MFHAERCDYCGQCLDYCYYMNFGHESGGKAIYQLAAGEEAEWINNCVICTACNEYCSKGARPFDLIIKRLEAKRIWWNEQRAM
ncbi:MAG: Fe-S oxidoreductase [Firmicutes bacterium]|nr:Fe-S oxidoreductase [Bacillota bacterium]